MNKDEIIEKFGKKDGFDEDRYKEAVKIASLIDKPLFLCFEGLINLENKGLVELVSCNKGKNE